jgi:hypothetical protein
MRKNITVLGENDDLSQNVNRVVPLWRGTVRLKGETKTAKN